MDLKSVYSGTKVLITGGLGFIGSNLARALIQLEANVTIVDSLIPQYGGNLFNLHDLKDRLSINIADVREQHAMNYLVQNKEYLFNLAGQVSHIDSMQDPFTDLEINCRSQLSILEACRHNNPDIKVIFASTRQQYGKPEYLPVDEKHPVHPTDVNGINKMAGEWYHILYDHVYGIQATSLRLTNTFGPGQLMKHNRQGFTGWFIRQAIDGEEIKIFGDGLQVRDFNYVEDVVMAFLLAGASISSNGNIYNLGGKEPTTLLDFVKMLLHITGTGSYTIVPFPPEKKRIDVGDFYADFSLIKKTLGWEPEVSLYEGLTQTVNYYRKNKQYYWN